MDGDGVNRCPPIPVFWLVNYKFTTDYQGLRKIQRSFTDLGFGVLAYTEEISYFKLYHYKPKYMSLWIMQNDELIRKYRLKVESYTHNTKRKGKKSWDTILQKSLQKKTA